ncbi:MULTISPECIES: hypothetical protein [unclassified Streptomyces]|uniref:hypothetical protein n=1 Tax=unclassified Streptomyces TaxID=2593676 RepID=UPI001942C823|nr:hypothetical protein [Streptomyces sp. SID10853]WSU41847.1 hypothetical protein OG510_11600 [Streptomyces sp. NBC_01089]
MLPFEIVLVLFGVLLGAVTQIPGHISLVALGVIGCWLVVFAIRERYPRTRR